MGALDGRLAQSLAGKLFCKNRFFDCLYSTFVCVGICFAKTGLSITPASIHPRMWRSLFCKNRCVDRRRSILACLFLLT